MTSNGSTNSELDRYRSNDQALLVAMRNAALHAASLTVPILTVISVLISCLVNL